MKHRLFYMFKLNGRTLRLISSTDFKDIHRTTLHNKKTPFVLDISTSQMVSFSVLGITWGFVLRLQSKNHLIQHGNTAQ